MALRRYKDFTLSRLFCQLIVRIRLHDWAFNNLEHQLKTEIITLTPEIASEFLAKNPQNRPVSQVTVDKYVSAMRRGEWKMNGQPIIIFDNGMLGDGQHRCHAVIKSGIPITQLVVRGIHDSAFATIDTGKNRNGADSLSLSGYTCTHSLSAGARSYMMENLKGRAAYEVTNTQIVTCVKEHPHLVHWNKQYYSHKKMRAFVPALIIGLLALSSEKHGIDCLQILFDKLAFGIGLTPNDPAYVLRERLMGQTSASRLTTATARAFCVKVINAHVEDRQIKLLKYADGIEEMPKII